MSEIDRTPFRVGDRVRVYTGVLGDVWNGALATVTEVRQTLGGSLRFLVRNVAGREAYVGERNLRRVRSNDDGK